MDIFKRDKGFTLVELLIVTSVMGILAFGLMLLINPTEQIKKANDSKRKIELSQIQKALEQYYNDNARYPAHSTTAPTFRIVSGTTTIDWGQAWLPYMATLPKDPAASNTFVYYAPDAQTYYLYANLERGVNDPQTCSGGGACASATANGVASACGGVCNYAVSSSNVSP